MSSSNIPSDSSGSAVTADPGEFVPQPHIAINGQPPESGFGARVQIARMHYRLNVEALSRLTKNYDEPDRRGVSGAAISRYESGDALPGAREFRLIAQSLGVSADWLLFGTISMSGKTGAQQRLVASVIELVRETVKDIDVGGVSLSSIEEHGAKMERRRRIEEARKPAQSSES